ncbi:MAG: S1/P1 nuclease [Hyphomicrobiaceae bacterium]
MRINEIVASTAPPKWRYAPVSGLSGARASGELVCWLVLEEVMLGRFYGVLAAAITAVLPTLDAKAWDHPGHMATVAIAFAEIERARPDLIDKIGLLMLKHPDPGPFWVAAGHAKDKERARRMFIQGSRWPDDVRWTIQDRPAWHTARWAITAADASPNTRKLAKARRGMSAGQAIEALILNTGVLTDPESKPDERSLALTWVLHIMGDIHQPLHTADLFSKQYPTGNPAGSLGFVADPLANSAMQLHLLWDSHTRRSVRLKGVDRYAKEIKDKFPRSALPELTPYQGPEDFEKWARESHQVAVEWAFEVKTIPDPEPDPQKVVQKMVKYILTGASPVKGAPKVPAEYWEKVQEVATRRLALAGYRIADIILVAADRIETEKGLHRQAMDAMTSRYNPK